MHRLILATLVLFLSVTLLPGCIGSGAGADAGSTYGSYTNRGTINASPQRIIESTKAVFKEMEIELVGEKYDEKDKHWEIKGKASSGDGVEVDIRQVGENVSEASVRVGLLGDRSYSATIYERIRARL